MRRLLLVALLVLVSTASAGDRWPDSSAVQNWTLVAKTATESLVSDNTLNDDAQLFFTMAPGKRYAVRGQIFFYSTPNADFSFEMSCPNIIAGEGYAETRWLNRDDTTAEQIRTLGDTSCGGTQSVLWTAAGNGPGWVKIDTVFRSHATTPFTFNFRWAQGTLHADTTFVLSGSYLEYRTF